VHREGLTQIKTVLVPIANQADYGALSTAITVAAGLGAHVQACHVGPSVFEAALAAMPRGPGGRLAGKELAERWQQMRNEEKSRSANARQHFHGLCERNGIPLTTTPSATNSVTCEWLETDDEHLDTVVGQIVERALYADLVVLRSGQDATRLDLIGELLMRTGRPFLVSGAEGLTNVRGHVLIAWKPAAEAARAVAAAMPLLRLAQKVTIGVAVEGSMDSNRAGECASRLAANLAWEGVRAETRVVQGAGSTAYDGLISLARDLKVDLLVMGAYGHSRTRELILGGFTRHMLHDAPVTALMMH
jgi:nucleotide-binding universal stress UspA family protein